jgi:hypothetical protein
MSTATEAETPVADPPARPGYCAIHPDERLIRAYGGARGGEPSCPRCNQIKAWERKKALHMRQPHQQFVACGICIQLQLEERQRLGLIPSGLTPWVASPIHAVTQSVLGGVPNAQTLPSPPGPVEAMPPTETPPQPTMPAITPARPAPPQIVVRGAEDIQHLAGSQPIPTSKEMTVVTDSAKLPNAKKGA